MDESNPWKKKSSTVKYSNSWIKVIEDKVITPTGGDGIYAFVSTRDSVIIIALNEKQEVCLVRGFNYPGQSWSWHLPGGGGDEEDHVEASKRELEEETGIKAKSWEKLGVVKVCNGVMDENMAICLARDLSFDGEKEVSDEKINDLKFVSLSEFDSMIDSSKTGDCQSIAAIYFLRRWLNQQ